MNQNGRLLPSEVKKHLSTDSFGRRVYYYPETDSTNRVALDLARRNEPEGTVVIADFQTKGEGRQNHIWYSRGKKDLLFTLVLRPNLDLATMLPMTLVFSAAVAGRLSRTLGVDVAVKWPNDMVTQEGKIGGVLAKASAISTKLLVAVVGVGVNVNSGELDFPAPICGIAASCKTLTGRDWDRAVILAEILEAMEDYYIRFLEGGFSSLKGEYESFLAIRGRRVYFERGGVKVEGTVEGVNDDGALRLTPAAGGEPLALYNEEVRLEE